MDNMSPRRKVSCDVRPALGPSDMPRPSLTPISLTPRTYPRSPNTQGRHFPRSRPNQSAPHVHPSKLSHLPEKLGLHRTLRCTHFAISHGSKVGGVIGWREESGNRMLRLVGRTCQRVRRRVAVAACRGDSGLSLGLHLLYLCAFLTIYVSVVYRVSNATRPL
jgi:hypothetical protein